MQYATLDTSDYPEAAAAYRELRAAGRDVEIFLGNISLKNHAIHYANDEEGIVELFMSGYEDDSFIFDEKGRVKIPVEVKIAGRNYNVTIRVRGKVRFELYPVEPLVKDWGNLSIRKTLSIAKSIEDALRFYDDTILMQKQVTIYAEDRRTMTRDELAHQPIDGYRISLWKEVNVHSNEWPDAPREIHVGKIPQKVSNLT